MIDFKKIFMKFSVNKYFYIVFLICLISGYLKEVLILFLFVMFHELSHIAVARMYKLEIHNIEIFPFGGVAKIDNLDSVGPLKESIISAAGPLFNILSVGVAFFLDRMGIIIPEAKLIININIVLALFNLLPGLPLDGGRILRSVLYSLIGYKRATMVCIIIGKVIAVMLLIIGIVTLIFGKINVSLLIMPVFLFFSASKEEENITYAIIKDIINKKLHLENKGIMEAVVICGYEEANLGEILKYFDLNKYHMIVIVSKDMKVSSIITETQVLDGLVLYGSHITLGQLIKKA